MMMSIEQTGSDLSLAEKRVFPCYYSRAAMAAIVRLVEVIPR
jgi:hypothetical protein